MKKSLTVLALTATIVAPDLDPQTLQMLRHNDQVLQCRSKQIDAEATRRRRPLNREEMIRFAQAARCPKFIILEDKNNVRNAR